VRDKSCSGTINSILAVVVFLVFLYLKVFGYVDWSWWIVTLPLWIGFVLVLLVLLIVFVLALIVDR
jgi:hypothetical protein